MQRKLNREQTENLWILAEWVGLRKAHVKPAQNRAFVTGCLSPPLLTLAQPSAHSQPATEASEQCTMQCPLRYRWYAQTRQQEFVAESTCRVGTLNWSTKRDVLLPCLRHASIAETGFGRPGQWYNELLTFYSSNNLQKLPMLAQLTEVIAHSIPPRNQTRSVQGIHLLNDALDRIPPPTKCQVAVHTPRTC